MTAKEYLQQLERADVIIGQKMKEQADLEELSKCVRAIDYSKDRISSSCSGDAPFVNPVLKIVQLEQEINAEINKYADLKHTIINQIHKVNDKQYVELLFKRYVEFKSLEKIAVEMGMSYDRVKHLHGYALQKFSKIALK